MKNVTVIIMVLELAAVAGAGFMALRYRGEFHQARTELAQLKDKASEPTKAPPKPVFLVKGDKLADSTIAKYAFKVAPGEMTDDTKNALTGFDIKITTQADKSLLVKLTPKDSDDQAQQYTVRDGNSLYFVEMSMGDDKDNVDKNLRDDYGIIVNADGIVQ